MHLSLPSQIPDCVLQNAAPNAAPCGRARLQRGKAKTSTASIATTINVTRVATTTATRVAITTATAAVAAAMRMMEADNYTDPSQRSDGPFAPQKRRLRTRTPSDAEGLGENQRPRRPVSNRTTTQSNRAPLGLPEGTARIFGVHGTEQHACPYYRAWESRCHWSVPLSPAAPLPRRGPRVGRLLILGDSLDAQLFAAVACNLYAHRGPDLQLEFEATWENGIAALKKRCDSLNRCHYTSATLRVHSANQARVPFRTMHLCQDSRVECLRKLNFDPATDVVATGLDALHGAAHGARGMLAQRTARDERNRRCNRGSQRCAPCPRPRAKPAPHLARGDGATLSGPGRTLAAWFHAAHQHRAA